MAQGESIADQADNGCIKNAEQCYCKVGSDHFRVIEVAEHGYQANSKADYSSHPGGMGGNLKFFVAALAGIFGNQQCTDDTHADP
ncbi:MAG: hypothetical protein CVV42_14765 [Candidatus Riflebacteria bacterium HGW-Riflebacteria-2]|nr:MAG: hypothetical protein CVV42_14765 [Candidatus Riflebacteria bacterium HGW-Riflebacteria-2]